MIEGYTHIEERNSRYYIKDQRVPVATIARVWKQGRSPETIRQDFPVLKLAEVYGAITFYLDHQQVIDQQDAEDSATYQAERAVQQATEPERYAELERRFAVLKAHDQAA
jgi:uncharacterized protein (DUF433 family)